MTAQPKYGVYRLAISDGFETRRLVRHAYSFEQACDQARLDRLDLITDGRLASLIEYVIRNNEQNRDVFTSTYHHE